jgi:thiamine biosynthesis lipoprotein
VITDTFQALGTTWWVEIFDHMDEKRAAAAIRDCALLSAEFENTYSRFKADSVLSKLNRDRRFENPSQMFRDIVSYGKSLYLRSDGHFNILVGHILESRGYDADYSLVPKGTEETSCNPITDLQLSDTLITLTCGKVDLGGFGKGYLINLMTEQLLTQGIKYFLINGGGDMYATSDHGEPIKIYLEHPIKPATYLEETSLLNQGFAASSPFKRQWVHDKQVYTHIVSENALEPVASFVKAATAAEADAFATTALLLSETMCQTLCHKETIEIARFNPSTSDFWQTSGFF